MVDTISTFTQHILTNGVTKQNRFVIIMTLPDLLRRKLRGAVASAEDILQLMCTNVDFPGYNIDTDDSVVNGHHFRSEIGRAHV